MGTIRTTNRRTQLTLAAELIDRATLAPDGLAREKWLALAHARIELADSLGGRASDMSLVYPAPSSGDVFILPASGEETRDATFYATHRPVTDSDGAVRWEPTDR